MNLAGPVLIFEPLANDAYLLEALVRQMGLTACVARSPAEAIGLVQREVFDAGILAVPEAMGPERVLGRLASLPATRLVVATGPANAPDLAMLTRTVGADVYLVRPVDVSILRAWFVRDLGCRERSPPQADRSP